MADERAVDFDCQGHRLIGIAHLPDVHCGVGVLIVVGGPQYRVGSHRQFVVLARYLADCGIAAFRFDQRGTGDSDGSYTGFLNIDDDIRCAIDQFLKLCPSISQLYVWGLCDAASAAMLYAHKDNRVTGIVLLNPWVRTESSLARTLVKSYYLRRTLDLRAWKNILANPRRVVTAISSFLKNSFVAIENSIHMENRRREEVPDPDQQSLVDSSDSYPVWMLSGLERFQGRILIVISGNDLTAAEFCDLVRASQSWNAVIERRTTTWVEYPDCDHTFSSAKCQNQVNESVVQWISDK